MSDFIMQHFNLKQILNIVLWMHLYGYSSPDVKEETTQEEEDDLHFQYTCIVKGGRCNNI